MVKKKKQLKVASSKTDQAKTSAGSDGELALDSIKSAYKGEKMKKEAKGKATTEKATTEKAPEEKAPEVGAEHGAPFDEQECGGNGVSDDKVDAQEAIRETARLARLEVAGTGVIPDARVFHLMYLEKCAIEASLQIQVRRTAYERRIEALKQELNNVVRQWENTQKKSVRRISDVRRELENDYGIYMDQWGYDEETGVLRRLPQEAEQEVKSSAPQNEDKLKGANTTTPGDNKSG